MSSSDILEAEREQPSSGDVERLGDAIESYLRPYIAVGRIEAAFEGNDLAKIAIAALQTPDKTIPDHIADPGKMVPMGALRIEVNENLPEGTVLAMQDNKVIGGITNIANESKSEEKMNTSPEHGQKVDACRAAFAAWAKADYQEDYVLWSAWQAAWNARAAQTAPDAGERPKVDANTILCALEEAWGINLEYGISCSYARIKGIEALAPYLQPSGDALRDEWQAIETAPKDGTKIWAYLDFKDKYPSEQAVILWGGDGRFPWKFGHTKEGVAEKVPTHWMPLPKPPEALRTTQAGGANE